MEVKKKTYFEFKALMTQVNLKNHEQFFLPLNDGISPSSPHSFSRASIVIIYLCISTAVQNRT